MIQTIFKCYWDVVEYFLVNPRNLRAEILKAHPDLADILYSEKGIRWLNETCKRGYKRIYEYTWLT